MKCKICGKSYKCNKCAYDKHIENHKMEPFKIRQFNDIGDLLKEIEKNNLFINHIKNKNKKSRLMKIKKII